MEHLLNNAPDENDEDARRVPTIKIENSRSPMAASSRADARGSLVAAQSLPKLAAQLAATSHGSFGLQMLSVSAIAPPRLPPISLLTAAATALQPIHQQQYNQLQPNLQQSQQRPRVITPSHSVASSTGSSSAGGRPADDMLCRYRNKKCGYPRAIKRNGDRHNLCERHRAKANQNQRKLESKRRSQKRVLSRVMQVQSGNVERMVKPKKVGASAETDIKFDLYGGAVA
ncbi:hypothetical protein BBJ28_00006520 [Nothophytophthora sp. Chile5]|nr:hypothetical protein BBJ28_00006520 [Nothophytophthora sp. Chile5]